MALSSRRRNRRSQDYWPGFVDAMAQLVIIIIFVLMVFVLAQFFLGQMLSGREAALERLSRQVAELSDLLAIERAANDDMRLNVEQLTAQLTAANAQVENLQATLRQTAQETARLDQQLTEAQGARDEDKAEIARQLNTIASLQQDIKALEALKADLDRQLQEMAGKLEERDEQLAGEQQLSMEARAHAALLEQQIEALKNELARLNETLEASEALSKEQEAQIADLGRRLNQALASKVQELQRYRSEFFGRLREILGNRSGIRIEGDRFVFQSEILFGTGSATLGLAGEEDLKKLAAAIKDISDEIPEDIDWILRVDGHTDRRPIRTPEFDNNWELSAARAIDVVEFLISQGVSPERLAAAGFGEYQPLVTGDGEEAMARNRRIELKLDQR